MNNLSEARGIGDNKPPLEATLADRYEAEIRLMEELLAAAKAAPSSVADDETQNKFAELIKKLRALEIALDKSRGTEKAPWQQGVDEVNGFFKTKTDQLEAQRLRLNKASKDYLDDKAAKEKRRLQEEEDARRELAAKKLREAQAAEETKLAEKNALNELTRLRDEAEASKSAAITDQEVAASEVAQAGVVVAEVKSRIASLAATFAQRVVDGNPATELEKAEARSSLSDELNKAKDAKTAAEEKLKAARQKAIEAKEAQRQADEAARKQAATVKAAQRDEDQALDDAVRETKLADRIAAKVEGPKADLAQTRSVHGAVSTLATRWTCSVIDRDKLDIKALWPHINQEAIDAALWKWMMAQTPENRVMAGAIMEKETSSQIR